MFFRRTMSRVASAIGLSRSIAVSPPSTLTSQTRTIEELLRAEYETAQAEFDLAKENSGTPPDVEVCRRYIQATEKLRKFLAHGEVPRDTMEKLHAEES